MRDPPDDFNRSRRNDLVVALARIGRAERRARVREALALLKAARRAGLPVASATIADVTLNFDSAEKGPKAPVAPAPGSALNGDINEWDQDFGAASPSPLRS
jgi:hypothetical protein